MTPLRTPRKSRRRVFLAAAIAALWMPVPEGGDPSAIAASAGRARLEAVALAKARDLDARVVAIPDIHQLERAVGDFQVLAKVAASHPRPALWRAKLPCPNQSAEAYVQYLIEEARQRSANEVARFKFSDARVHLVDLDARLNELRNLLAQIEASPDLRKFESPSIRKASLAVERAAKAVHAALAIAAGSPDLAGPCDPRICQSVADLVSQLETAAPPAPK